MVGNAKNFWIDESLHLGDYLMKQHKTRKHEKRDIRRAVPDFSAHVILEISYANDVIIGILC